MMLWLVFRVRTSTLSQGNRSQSGAPPTTVAGPSVSITRPARDTHRHGPKAASLTAQPDSCLGPPGPHRCLDRAPARRPRLRAARVPPPPRAQRGGRGGGGPRVARRDRGGDRAGDAGRGDRRRGGEREAGGGIRGETGGRGRRGGRGRQAP